MKFTANFHPAAIIPEIGFGWRLMADSKES
jgi:hypothetical protein